MKIEQIAMKREIASLTPIEEAVLISEVRLAYIAMQKVSSDPLNVRITQEATHADRRQVLKSLNPGIP